MKIIRMSQSGDREAWLDFRRGKITGTKNKGIRPLTRGADRTPQGFWQLVAERISIAPDGEKPIDRGTRCENEALQRTADKYKLELDLDPGVWVSDIDENNILSPDAAEPGDTPTYAAEAKCFDSANHVKYVVTDRRARKEKDYNPFKSVPKDNQDQLLDYFAVNEHLETVYFTLDDDRIVIPELAHHVIIVNRKDVEGDVELLKDVQKNVLKEVDNLVAELLKEVL